MLFAAIDLTASETAILALGVAVVASSATVIPGAVAVRAVKAGSMFIVRLFTRMMG